VRKRTHNLKLVLDLLARKFEEDPPSAFPDPTRWQVGEIDWAALADAFTDKMEDPDLEWNQTLENINDLLGLIASKEDRALTNAFTLALVAANKITELYEFDVQVSESKWERVLSRKNLGGHVLKITEDSKEELAKEIYSGLPTNAEWHESQDAEHADRLIDLLAPDNEDLFIDDRVVPIPIDWRHLGYLLDPARGTKRKAEDDEAEAPQSKVPKLLAHDSPADAE
jgi:hypothetical protein